jgi:hypothetical protein
MGLDIIEIGQKVLDNNTNAANVFRKMYDLHYNPNPLDVPFEYIDENGNKVTTNVPNMTKIKSNIGFNLCVVSAGFGGGTSNASAGIYINGVKVHYPGRSQNICVIDIEAQKIIDSGKFDTYGDINNATLCKEYIENIFTTYTSSKYLFVFYTNDEPANNLTDDLKTTVSTYFKADLFGVNRLYRDAYLCVFRNSFGKLAEKKSVCGDCNNANVSVQLQIK